MKTTVKVNRVDNLTTKQRDEIIESANTINLTGELSTRQKKQKLIIEKKQRVERIKARKNFNLKNKMMNKLAIPVFVTMIILIIGLSIHNNGVSADEQTFETELEKVIEKNDKGEVTDEDLDKLIDILDKEYNEENEITPENIEGSDKSYEEFMKKGEELHQLKYEEQKKNR